jgi:hypothetical protein
MKKRPAKKPKRRSAIVPAAVFALAVVGVVPNLAACGDDSNNMMFSVAQTCFASHSCPDLSALGVANIGFDMFSVADIAFHD